MEINITCKDSSGSRVNIKINDDSTCETKKCVSPRPRTKSPSPKKQKCKYAIVNLSKMIATWNWMKR